MVKVKKADIKEIREAKKLAKLVATIEEDFTKKLLKTPKGKREKSYGCLNSKSGETRIWSFPKEKPPKTLSKWRNTSNLLSTPYNQMRWKRRTQKLLTFQKNQSRHPNGQKKPKRPWRLKQPKWFRKP